eukprot:3390303-Karenia_brevis.AAC.1
MPRELIGLEHTINGEQPCYAFNLEGCKQGSNGRCARGVHKCMRKGCGGPHSQRECNRVGRLVTPDGTPSKEAAKLPNCVDVAMGGTSLQNDT